MTLVIIEEAFYSSSIEYNLMKEENYDCMWIKRMSNKKNKCQLALLYLFFLIFPLCIGCQKQKYLYSKIYISLLW